MSHLNALAAMLLSYVFLVLYFLCKFASGQLPVIDLPDSITTIAQADVYVTSLNITQYENGTDCKRPCEPGKSRICYRVLHIENFVAMGPGCGDCARGVVEDCYRPQCVSVDGTEKSIITINRQIPAPLLEVCQNDLMVMDVHNQMYSESFTMHWHGILHLRSPYMDGVPFVTQCPINPASRFRYTYFAEQYGTSFYHSHSSEQRYNGAFGALIVRMPRSLEQISQYYDEDLSQHVMVLADWIHDTGEMFLMGLPSRKPGLLPVSLLINGHGKFRNKDGTYSPTPYEAFYVQPNKRYRFRIVNAASTVCPLQIQFESHKITIISVDGNQIYPFQVDTLYLHSGERADVVIETNQPVKVYWIHIRSMGFCFNNNITQNAIFSYEIPKLGDFGKFPEPRPPIEGFPLGTVISEPDLDCNATATNFCIKDLDGIDYPASWNRPVVHREYLAVDSIPMNTTAFFSSGKYLPYINFNANNIFSSTINGITNKSPSHPLLSQGKENSMSQFCNQHLIPDYCKNMQICVCSHVLSYEQNSMLEFIIFDSSPINVPVVHPIHIHGHKFGVIAQGRLNYPLSVEKLKELDSKSLLNRNYKYPAMKDTVAVQNQGYAILRFEANNPGAWMIHCHIDDHATSGMSMTIAIKGPIPPVPNQFPRCGNFPE